MNLKHSRVWLTGASSGIGAALVDVLVARGARVAITARRVDRLEAAARRHPGVLAVPGDVTDRDAVVDAARLIEAAWGGIDLAIFNAGGRSESTKDGFSAEPYVDTMTLNYFSVVYGLDAVLPGMIARGGGRIAAVASLAGYRGLPTAVAYGASKAAVIHLLEALRFGLAPKGVFVTVINPGFVRTPLTDRNQFDMPFLIDAGDAAERIVRGLEQDRKEIHFPPVFSWMVKLLRVLPYPLYEWVMMRWIARASRVPKVPDGA